MGIYGAKKYVKNTPLTKVSSRRKSYMGKPYNPYKHPLQYEEPKTYEIMITSRGFSIDDPKNNLGILFVMDADKETWELGS